MSMGFSILENVINSVTKVSDRKLLDTTGGGQVFQLENNTLDVDLEIWNILVQGFS